MGVVEMTVEDLLGEGELSVEPGEEREREYGVGSPGEKGAELPLSDDDEVVLDALVVDELVLLED